LKRRSRFCYFCCFFSLISFSFLYSSFLLRVLFFDIVHKKKHSRSSHCFFFCSGINRQENNGKLTSEDLRLLFSLSLSRNQISFFSSFFCPTSNNQWVTKSFPLIKKKKTLLFIIIIDLWRQWFLLFENVKTDNKK